MISVFHSGELYLKLKQDKKLTFVYPKIHDLKIDQRQIRFVFSVPTGLSPEKVREKEWIFKQAFGDNIEITGKNKRFILTIFNNAFNGAYDYSFNEISKQMKNYRLPIIAGKDKRGRLLIYDMVTYPHLLIAGETGSGKSTQLRAILTALIQSQSEDKLQMYLADMKRSEFHLFKRVGIVKEVVTDVSGLIVVLKKLKSEMIKRGKLLEKHEVAHVDELPVLLPYIVLCIDEVALLQKEKNVMEIVEEISAIGRALGVFLILSMQRPDAQVLDGKLKNNLTVRMAFRHSDAINSRITLGSNEAADININDKGRMYLKLEQLHEVQGPFLSVEHAKEILEPFKVNKIETCEKKPIEPIENELPVFGLLEGDK